MRKSVLMVEKEEDDNFISIPIRVEYAIAKERDEFIVKKITYPAHDKHGNFCDNKYEDEYVIRLYNPAWAKLEKWRLNKGFASMERAGAWDVVLLFRETVRRSEVKELVNEIKNKLNILKDGDPEIKTVVKKVEEFFDKRIAKYEDP